MNEQSNPAEWMVREFSRSMPQNKLFALLVKYGRTFETRRRPKGMRKRAVSACFANAGRIALSDPRFRYAEGYAARHDIGVPLMHAWLVDAEGFAIDPTWDGDASYFGVIFTPEEHRQALRLGAGYYSLLDYPCSGLDQLLKREERP